MKITIIGNGWLGKPLRKLLRAKGLDAFSTQRTFTDEAHVLNFPSTDSKSTELLQNSAVVVLAFPPDRTNVNQYSLDCLAICAQIPLSAKVILISSTGVYSDERSNAVESDIDYSNIAENKLLLAEKALIDILKNRLTIVRMAGLVGAGRYPVTAMARSGKSYDGNSPVNLIHLDDAIGIIYYIIRNNIWGDTINACAPNHPTKQDYYKWMAKELGITPPNFIHQDQPSKVVISDKSIRMGYEYLRSDPYQFLYEETKMVAS